MDKEKVLTKLMEKVEVDGLTPEVEGMALAYLMEDENFNVFMERTLAA